MKNIFIFLIICVLTLNYGISKPNDKTDLTIENLNQYSLEIKSQMKDSINSIDKRLIRIETKQEDYYSNLNFYSILIAVIMAVAIALSAFFVNFNNKNMLLQFEQRQNELDSNIKELRKNQEKFEDSVENSKKEIEKIISGQGYFYFETFDTLSRIHYNDFIKYKEVENFALSILTLTNSWTFFNIRNKFVPNERKIIYKSNQTLNAAFNELNDEINEKARIEIDPQFTLEIKQIIIDNLKDSLKFVEDETIKQQVQNIIDKFETYKTQELILSDESN